MAFRLKPHEDAGVNEGLRRIVRGELERSLRTLADAVRGGDAGSQDEAVHVIRKSLKRTRAVLRLLRDELGESRYHRENFALRDAARPLTPVRDAKVFVDTLAALKSREAAGGAGSGAFARAGRQLAANRRAVSKKTRGADGTFEGLGADLTAALATALERVEQWRLGRGGWSRLEPGLKRAYRRARRAGSAAEERTTSRRLHEWRKQTKYLLYQLQILEPSWGEVEKKLAGALDRLADLLGEDHDLAELRGLIEERDIVAMIDGRRVALEREAFALGRATFERRPGKVIHHLHDAWIRWQG
jgi:CHAD domain-containing protein